MVQAVQYIKVSADEVGQRIDNYLIKKIKGLPKSRLYRALRKGEVRVNKGRIKPEYRIAAGDEIRVPPLDLKTPPPSEKPSQRIANALQQAVLYEDEGIIVVNKPAGMPVHGGSGVRAGLIEHMRQLRPSARQLALVHRLDRDTSGCLVLAKKRRALLSLSQQWAEREVEKHYLVIVLGQWQRGRCVLDAPLLRRNNKVDKGPHVVVHPNGKPAFSEVKPLKIGENASLLAVRLLTGRTHQIRVHCADAGHPILGDVRYGDWQANHWLAKQPYQRLFLHAEYLAFTWQGEHCRFAAPAETFAECFKAIDEGLAQK